METCKCWGESEVRKGSSVAVERTSALVSAVPMGMFLGHACASFHSTLVVCFLLLISNRTTASAAEPNTTTAADSVISFNEVMYHPAGDDPALEWIELYNQMSVNMD